ncbi:hypothetical protein BV25DRAFT_1824248 [Artomyces pyxidatus]|uniref:Uncharacterized protein n=1 Tax=Artomyces pyxidatus TaxID=48021 RepID=A0ACB8T6R1_9AGAM|nr:hypothetical protein BV25DRAFT_1824248 [Artomyces pyxidatus]
MSIRIPVRGGLLTRSCHVLGAISISSGGTCAAGIETAKGAAGVRCLSVASRCGSFEFICVRHLVRPPDATGREMNAARTSAESPNTSSDSSTEAAVRG